TNALPDFHYGDDWNARHGAAPSEKDLAAARRTDSFVGALIAVCVYLIARGLGARVAGVAAALLLIPHPLSVYLSSLADSDAILSLLLALAIFAAMALADRPTWPRAIVLGILLGLGGSAKLSPLALAIPLAALGASYVLVGVWRRRPADIRHMALGWRLLTLPPVALATFIVAYPFLWPNPIGRVRDLFAFREQEMTNQGRIWPQLRVDGPGDAIARIGNWLGTVDSTSGSAAAWIAARFGHQWHPVGIDLLLGLIGAEVLVFLVFRHGLASRWGLAAAMLFGQVGLIVVGMRADFERYLLPVVVTIAVCGGLAVGQAWTFARAAIAHRAARRVAAKPGAVDLPGQIAQV
ncbi:MAG TPA: glycosyltransferase family 39 protein, partial [Thermomicrobiales bacterium]|nr:glycosyltransferase family 39 protein [Thermomicrobiales bacterium]